MDYNVFNDVFEKFGYKKQTKNIFYKHMDMEQLQGFVFEELDHKTTFRIVFFYSPYLGERKKVEKYNIELSELQRCGLNTSIKSFYEINDIGEKELLEINQELEQNVLPFFENFLVNNKAFWNEFIDIDKEDMDYYENNEIFHMALMEIKYRNNYSNAEMLLNYMIKERSDKISDREKKLFMALEIKDEEQKKTLVDEIIKEVERNFLSNNRKFKK